MEQTIIGLVGLGLALMLYLDRGHRAGFARMDQKMDQKFERIEQKFERIDERFERLEHRFDERFERLAHRFDDKLDQLEERLERNIEESARRTDARINELNHSVIELAQSVGRVEGRTEALAAVE